VHVAMLVYLILAGATFMVVGQREAGYEEAG
jgi:hypothetical protein